MKEFIKWVGGILATVISGVAIWYFTVGPPENSQPRPDPDSIRQMIVRITPRPQTISPGGSTTISVEVLSKPDSPIEGASVEIVMGGGVFRESGDRIVHGRTNPYGFYAAHWTCPPSAPSPYGYYVTVKVTKAGFEGFSKRIKINIR